MKEIVQIEIILDFINWETTSVKVQLNQNSKNLTMYLNLNICPGNDKRIQNVIKRIDKPLHVFKFV